MFAIAILFASTLLQETSDSLGKKAVKARRETIYNLAFLGIFWSLVFLVIIALLGAPLRVTTASLPTLVPRIILEATLAYVGAEAIVRADRSTMGFLRLLTIPLLLIVDILLGYHLTTVQFVGIAIMFCGLFLAFHHNPRGKKGAGLVILGALISVATASLYKWDVTHYNSIAGEQIVLYSYLLTFFYVQSMRHSRVSPLQLLVRPRSGPQALSSGLSSAIESFAIGFAPASVVISLKRSFALMWSIFFGHTYFHERGLQRKAYSGVILVTGLVMLTSPYLKL
jgi:hypothetical protein